MRIEEFSLAVVMAMAGQIGLQAKWTRHDRDTTDIELEGQGYTDNGEPMAPPGLKIQVKGVSGAIRPLVSKPGHFSFQIPSRKNWDDLRLTKGISRILVVVECPEADRDRLEVCDGRILLSARAWWFSLRGFPEIEGSAQSKVVHIPLSQRLTPVTLAANLRPIV